LWAPTFRRYSDFVTELSGSVERKTVLNLLGTLNAVLTYAKKCGIRAPAIPAGSLVITGDRDHTEAVYFKSADVQRIPKLAREPYRTIFTLAAFTGLRAGELLGLNLVDVDFERLMISPRKQADERTRELRELKTKKSRLFQSHLRQPLSARTCKGTGREMRKVFCSRTGEVAPASGQTL
jgi:integrase